MTATYSQVTSEKETQSIISTLLQYTWVTRKKFNLALLISHLPYFVNKTEESWVMSRSQEPFRLQLSRFSYVILLIESDRGNVPSNLLLKII